MAKPVRVIISVLVFCAGLPNIVASTESQHTAMFSDGRQVPVEEVEAIVQEIGDGLEIAVARPWQGTVRREHRLLDLGVSLDPVPDMDRLKRLEPVTSGVGIEVVIGADARVRTYTTNYPASAVVLITFDGGRCSGWLIGADTVVTAGHCVHTGGALGDWRTGFTVYPGFDPPSTPFGSCGAVWLASVSGWTANRLETHDYGVVKLDCDVGTTTGWFGMQWKRRKAALKNFPSAITGYPGDKPLEQWQSHDKIRTAKGRQIFYKSDTAAGMSGSPVWYDRGKNGPVAIGIHAYGLHGSGPHSKKNHGTRITETVFNNLVFWGSEPK